MLDEVVRAVIHHAIGVARVGNSPEEYYLGPEVPDPHPAAPGFYKDASGAIKREAARFRLYGDGMAIPPRTPLQHLKLSPTGDGWLAVGDAATAFDPISSQGILTALHTGLTGALALHAHLTGDPTALPSYRTTLQPSSPPTTATTYTAEPRWPTHPFWSRRHTPPEHLRRRPLSPQPADGTSPTPGHVVAHRHSARTGQAEPPPDLRKA
ncbi:LodA/GoxA family CTQ-dependent oxidase [Kitasatospora mediocidica]|uniref:LodA/GoxA family CTQ-dependent oxidase n=1 Tax=Kitasatospora mediocidica TaxID=58352 RepID=UPI0006895568|nr:LodA/GoxA family CTQ-dependent oxidase [Kitasatospora mediocidica]